MSRQRRTMGPLDRAPQGCALTLVGCACIAALFIVVFTLACVALLLVLH